MIRAIVRTAVMLVANAVGLIIAALVLDGVDINVTGFVIAVVLFTIAFGLMTPFLEKSLRRSGSSSAVGGVALIATLIALIITDLVSDGLSIDGLTDWIVAAVIVWLTSLLAFFILPFFGLRKYLEHR